MESFFKFSLRKSFTLLFGIQLFLIFFLGVLILLLFNNQQQLAKSRDVHYDSYLLADELRQSSDDLTNMVRAYVATGNPKYEQEYWSILDIRNGIKPRPDGEKISLQTLMIKEGFTKEELEKLNTAQKNSDQLVKAETAAINAMKGSFDDGTGNFTIKKEPDREMANNLVNGDEYFIAKAEIMKPIDEFYRMFEDRTAQTIAMYLQRSTLLFWTAMLFVLFIIITFLPSVVVIRRQIVEAERSDQKLRELHEQTEQLVKDRTAELEKSKQLLESKLAENKKLNKFMVGRELKMIELKKELQKQPIS